MEVHVAKHVRGMVALALSALLITGCKTGVETKPLRLDRLLSRPAAHESSASATARRRASPMSAGALSSPPTASGTPGQHFPKSFSVPGTTATGVRSKLTQTANSIKDAMTIRPKVTPATDPTSLASDPGPLQPELFVSAAAVLEQHNRVAEATDKYQQALTLDPTHRAALIGLARLRHRTNDVAGAIQTYRTALQAYPDDAVLLNDLALCYARAGQPENALPALQRAVELNPSSTLYRNNMAAILVAADRTAEALPLLAETYGTAVAYYNLGYLLHQRGKDEAAVQHFAAALEANPSLSPARVMLDQLAPQLSERPVRRSHLEKIRLPSAAVPARGTGSPAAGDPSASALRASPAAWTAYLQAANQPPAVVPSVATDLTGGKVAPALHLSPPPTSDAAVQTSEPAETTSADPGLLRRPISATRPSQPGQLAPPIPLPVSRDVQAGFLPTPDPPQAD